MELEPLGREAGLWWCEPGAGGGTGVGGETGPESGEKWPCWVLMWGERGYLDEVGSR